MKRGLPFWVPPALHAGAMSGEEIEIAKERSRQGAALIFRADPVKRAEGERLAGVEVMRARYPEAYEKPKPFLDYLRWWSTSG